MFIGIRSPETHCVHVVYSYGISGMGEMQVSKIHMLKILPCVILIIFSKITFGQQVLHLKDSIAVTLDSRYDQVSKNHRLLFGENYRKEWAAKTTLPVIRISEIQGGLHPTKLGGGHQSHSLRLEEQSGKDWVLRSVKKSTDGLAPDVIKGSFYEKLLDDNFSAQHPYSALIVPVLADAVRVPHTAPVIGWVAPDKALGKFSELFAGTICLLEEREPYGDTDNTSKMLMELEEDNDHYVDSTVFFRARLLDLLVADWGRHEDQWRWHPVHEQGEKKYLVIPRDRDQVLYVNDGVLTHLVTGAASLSFLEGFNANYKDPNAFFFNGRKLNQQFLNQFTYQQWMKMTREFVAALPDQVLRKAVRQLPEASYTLNGEVIFNKLKGRRDNMMSAMDTYYRFLYHIVDVRTSDKAEDAEFTQTPAGNLHLTIFKLSENGEKHGVIFSNEFDPAVTREIRLFAGKGHDSVYVDVPSNKIKIRIIGGEGNKSYQISRSKLKIPVYENLDQDHFSDPHHRLLLHRSSDTLNVSKRFSDLYRGSGIKPAADTRSLDGILLGLTYKIEKEGFQKEPYGSVQKLTALHSVSTRAFILEYDAEWLKISRNTDVTINARADMAGNIMNFFGSGNDTEFDRTGAYRRFYRANFSYYTIDPAFRLALRNNMTLSVGPSFQYFTAGKNDGRFISYPEALGSFEKLSEDKMHLGAVVNYNWNTANDRYLPSKGINFNLRLHGYEGLNGVSEQYAQLFPQFAIYHALDLKKNIVLAERIGAAFTTGETAFYQSAFLGSQDNLLGFRKQRFAGDQVLYNNIELRVNIPGLLSYTMPGKVGLIAFYDAGRVWVKNEDSNTIHHGYGAGLYLSPFGKIFFRAVAGFSKEGWQPTVSLKQRF